ncbi:hypothetical protein F383_05057 [Gossypium arboreum]|uniref:Uncharacterized protein n=1 Tax=Gossypium arboreum TaxID=29729 RepID=A0A0B0N0U2_GOSAR|nr:hypothetical protein F383_35080 [Gossypium arboreum]KHG15189.1 hypothetical protein F383_05057 [Gossypium arboreum]
MDLTHTPG